MKLLCSSSSLTFVHSLRIALDGEGIGTFCSDADSNLSSIAGPMTGTAARIYLLDEEDWDRAVAVMKRLDPSIGRTQTKAGHVRGAWPQWVWIGLGLIAAIVVAGILGGQR
jgi:hypothetical protein